MDVLIIEESSVATADLVSRLRAEGCRVVQTGTIAEATRLIHLCRIDLLIADLLIGDETTLGIVMAAQYHNPELATILLNDTRLFAQGELFGMLSSLRCVLGKPAPTKDVMNIASYLMEETTPEGHSARRVVPSGGSAAASGIGAVLAGRISTRMKRRYGRRLTKLLPTWNDEKIVPKP